MSTALIVYDPAVVAVAVAPRPRPPRRKLPVTRKVIYLPPPGVNREARKVVAKRMTLADELAVRRALKAHYLGRTVYA